MSAVQEDHCSGMPRASEKSGCVITVLERVILSEGAHPLTHIDVAGINTNHCFILIQRQHQRLELMLI